MNYINALPDFLTMQRTSFCWFISQGLTEELQLVSEIHDFDQNTEYVILGNEYKLIKPIYNLSIARKYSGNYKAQLIIPIELRNSTINNIYYQNQFPVINLPLMTTYATFIVNGCERVVVSQIIRSPGIYFEKHKNQKIQRLFKRKLSAEITRLRAFLPGGTVSLTDLQLFLSIPTYEIYYHKRTNTTTEKTIPYWNNISIHYYSIKHLKNKKKEISFYFLKSFKFYRIITKTVESNSKIKLIQIFLKWLILKNQITCFKFDLKKNSPIFILSYFQFVLNYLLKYQILKSFLLIKKYNHINSKLVSKDRYKLANSQLQKVLQNYNKLIVYSQISLQLKLNYKLVFLAKSSNFWLLEIYYFKFLKKKIQSIINEINILTQLINHSNLRPTICFSTSLKDGYKYDYGFKTVFKINKENRFKFNRTIKKSILPKHEHKYLKSLTQFNIYKLDYQLKTRYNHKYGKKDLYNAILIPDYGSWVRFEFQKNTKMNFYKYPLKNQEEEILISLDKINKKPVLYLLKEIGLTDLEIYNNLQHSDFFYFDKPLLINSKQSNQPIPRFFLNAKNLTDISDFLKLFDINYYRLGLIGRLKINNRLNLQLSNKLQNITYEDIFAIIDKLINLTISKTISDDIDHLKNRRVRSIGELLQNLFRIGFQRLIRKSRTQINENDSDYTISFAIINTTLKEFFGSSQLSQYLDQTNPLSSLTHRRRISGLGPGGFDRDRISFAVRDIHPSHYGRICPIETPEGQNVGLIASLTTCARVNKLGFLETPFWRVINGKVLKTGNPIYLTADIEDLYKIAPADIPTNNENYLLRNLISVRYRQDFLNVIPSEVDFIAVSTVQVVSIAASLIPFFEHDDANRALMGSNMQRQSVPLLLPQKPIIGTGLENQIAINSGMTINAHTSGIINSVTANRITVTNEKNQKIIYKLQKYLRSNQQTCINHRPIVWKGEKIKSGQILTDGPAIMDSELALGQNVLIAYMPWQGYNFEDAILISEKLVYDDIFTSIHIERYRVEIDQDSDLGEEITNLIPSLSISALKHLNKDGIIKVGTFVTSGNILVGKLISNNTAEQLPESKLLRAIFGSKTKGVKDNSYRMPEGESGRVIETVTYIRKAKQINKFERVYIFIAQIRKIQVGDKIAGRHGNKGIISRILARQDMPFLPDGRPIDIILNPLGVPSRMNVGQLYECLLGLAGDKLNSRFKILPFDEMYGLEMSRILINKKLRQASIKRNESWLFNPYAPGKMVLIDGRTGKEFENPITVGNAYMLKLIHLVDDKMHSRATGPYSLITQQPLRGKAQHGGQRFGEMEVWALEGFGAAFTLKELLTIKSDDMQGRNETLNAIVKGQQIPKFGIPESFKVLLQELRSIGLDLSTYKIEKFSSPKRYEVEVNLIEKYNALSKTFSPTSNINDISF